MPGKSDVFENDLLKLIFQNTNLSGIGTPGLVGSSSAGSLYVSLHTADPGDAAASGQSTSEISYTGYARVAVSRASGSGGFTITGNTVKPTDAVTFGAMTGGTGGTATYFGVGTESTGTGKLLYSGGLSPTIIVTTTKVPVLTNNTSITED